MAVALIITRWSRGRLPAQPNHAPDLRVIVPPDRAGASPLPGLARRLLPQLGFTDPVERELVNSIVTVLVPAEPAEPQRAN